MSCPLTVLCALVLASGMGACLRADEAEDQAALWVGTQGGLVQRDETAPGRPVVSVILRGVNIRT